MGTSTPTHSQEQHDRAAADHFGTIIKTFEREREKHISFVPPACHLCSEKYRVRQN